MPLVGLFGTLNPTDGGNSQRYSLQTEWHRERANSRTKITLYGFYYDLDLFSDFTYYLTDPVHGDQFEQKDRRWVAGLDARHTIFSQWFGRKVENTFGLQIRNDWVHNGLFQTENRERVDKTDSDTGTTLPATTQEDRFTDTQVGVYVENKIQWAEKFRTVAALRGDVGHVDVTSLVTPANSGTATKVLPSPKLSLIFGPWSKTEFYVQGGFGFHSNDARGATQTVQPVSDENPYPNTPGLKNSSSDPNQRRGNRRAQRGRCRICKAPFRSGISAALLNCSRVAIPAALSRRTAEQSLWRRMGELLHASGTSGFRF